MEPGEAADDCARRECLEEIGLELGDQNLIGPLDDFVTRSGFVMTPLLYWHEGLPRFQLDPNEVASAHVVPWCEFDRPGVPGWRPDADPARLLRMPVEGTWVHAPTAAVLYQAFRWVWSLEWTEVRTAQQPRFAWR